MKKEKKKKEEETTGQMMLSSGPTNITVKTMVVEPAEKPPYFGFGIKKARLAPFLPTFIPVLYNLHYISCQEIQIHSKQISQHKITKYYKSI